MSIMTAACVFLTIGYILGLASFLMADWACDQWNKYRDRQEMQRRIKGAGESA